MEHKLKAWIVFPASGASQDSASGSKGADGTKFGAGRARLLRLIDAEGSLNKAVKLMGMSYRAAWGYVKELEADAGFAFVEPAGTGPSAGMRLTTEGRAFLNAFETYRARLDAAADEAFSDAFGDGFGARGPRAS